MKTRRPSASMTVAVASVVLATLFLAACQQSQPTPVSSATPATVATSEKVFVVFEGPWAFVTDPKDANSVLALAPKTKLHRDLYVAASNDSTLQAGVYDLSVPEHGAGLSGTLDAGFAQAKISPKALQTALDAKAGRYVIRLPKPEAYVAARRVRSRVGASYPPDASTEQPYATFVSFRYKVGSLNGFSLAGTPDNGTFTALPLQLETPTVRFSIEPAQFDDPKDMCHFHSREAFGETAKFLNLTLYVDFPGDPEYCHKTDPQIPRSTTAAVREYPFANGASNLIAGLSDSRTAIAVDGGMLRIGSQSPAMIDVGAWAKHFLSAALFLFHAQASDCDAPPLFLTPTS